MTRCQPLGAAGNVTGYKSLGTTDYNETDLIYCKGRDDPRILLILQNIPDTQLATNCALVKICRFLLEKFSTIKKRVVFFL